MVGLKDQLHLPFRPELNALIDEADPSGINSCGCGDGSRVRKDTVCTS